MSEATAPAAKEASPGDAPPPAKKSGGLMTKVIALVFMLTVVVTECLVGYVWFFSPSDGAVAAKEHDEETAGDPHGDDDAHAEKPEADHGHGKSAHASSAKSHGEKAASGHGDSGHGGGGHGAHGAAAAARPAPRGEYVEVDLGKYSVMAFQPGANAMRVIEFHLYGTIANAQHRLFERLWEENQQRCRDQVIVTIRSSEVEDFTDPGLGLIKRKILARTNGVLGKPLIEEIVFSEFSFIEE